MIVIDNKSCNACGLCLKICHESCIHIENGELNIDFKYCSTCTQCIAICPSQALSWDGSKPDPFNKSLYPNPIQIDELLKERRTIRDYKNEKIERKILEEIVGYAVYAPTHNFNFRAIIIDDEEIINQISHLIFKFSHNIYKWFFKRPTAYALIKVFAPFYEGEYLKAKSKLERVRDRKSGFKTKPAAVILIIGDKRTPLSLESAQYALYNMDLYAQTKGIACRNLVGNQMILNRNKKFRKLIGLNKKEQIFSTITMGYPAVKFKNKVMGKSISIQWNSMKNKNKK